MDNKNLPAFPDPQRGSQQSFLNQSPWDSPTGLTKLELFTAIALNGILSSNPYNGLEHNQSDLMAEDAIYIARHTLDILNK